MFAPMDRRAALKVGLVVVGGSLLSNSALPDEPAGGAASGELQDRRLGNLKDLDGYFPFTPSRSPEEWQQRAAYLRRRLLVASGLVPFPTVSPVNATVHGLVDRDEYTVEKVFFESSPGLYVTGNLYRPKGREGRRPAVLCPHGHWANGRFFEHSEDAIQQELKSGAEKFPVSGRYPLQARSVHLARMGCVVFHYDMLGYADSVPLTQEVAHGLAKQRQELTSPDHWGLFSAQAELRLINALGLQTFNSIRALDWVSSLPEVDPERIGVTGASGGGTQTFMLAAVDDRPAAAFPAVMVSTAMQGGCTCENACYLRIETGNIEIAALCAPRPLGMSAANDWTVEIETKGLPELKQHYQMLGVPDRVEGKYFDFGHNYNYVSRAMMYKFFNKHLQIGADDQLEERDFQPLSKEELSVWNDQHPKPAQDVDAELRMLQAWDENSNQQLASLVPSDQASWQQYQSVLGSAIDIMVGRAFPASSDIAWEPASEEKKDGYVQLAGRLNYAKYGESIPALILRPHNWNPTDPASGTVAWIHANGKQSLFSSDGRLHPAVSKLLAAGRAVASIDVLYTGDFLSDGMPLTETRKVANPREIAAFTCGYNHPLFAQRAHDVMTLLAFLHSNDSQQGGTVDLIGFGPGAVWALAACHQSAEAVRRLAVFTDGFRFASITSIRDPQLWPGAVKYGDVPGLLSLRAGHALWVAGEGSSAPDVVHAAYAATNSEKVVSMHDGAADDAFPKLIEWLTA